MWRAYRKILALPFTSIDIKYECTHDIHLFKISNTRSAIYKPEETGVSFKGVEVF